MLAPGFMLGERYEIIEKIGAGGMSIVYKAKCHKLQRFVAVKVLRDEFAKDEMFVKKFRVEALSAASLSHPNIVGIYDVGAEQDLHYIVMEYVEGCTLKELIKQKGALSTEKVLEYGVQIVSAIRHAHRKQIIHRDIKPQNILVGHDHVLKVTDFGIARAVDSSTIVNTGNAIGSVHYFSPEQARGKYINETSDLYSCGIVLFELATNRLPFEADSHVSIALKHINEDLPHPSLFNPSISKGLEQLILKATKKKPEDRYQNADEMLEDMKKLLADPNYVVANGIEEVCLDQTILLSPEESQMLRETPVVAPLEEKMAIPVPPVIAQPPKEESAIQAEPGYVEEEEEEDVSTSYKILVMAGGFLATLVLMGIALATLFFFMPSMSKPKYISVPSVVEKTKEVAEQTLQNANLKMKVAGYEESALYPEGTVVRQTPNASEAVKPGSTIEVILVESAGVVPVEQVKVPDVTGINASEAQRQLDARELTYDISMTYHDSIPQGKVIEQVPVANTMVNKWEVVTLVISNGPETSTTIVPNLYNMLLADAEVSLRNYLLEVGEVKQVESETIEAGRVVGQGIRANSQVEQGTAVTIEVSSGPPKKEEEKPEEEVTPPVEEQPEVVGPTSKTHVLKLPISVEDKEEYYVMVTFETAEGIRTLYEGTVRKEQFPLPITITGQGSGRLITYFDGKAEYDDRVDFNEET